MTRLAVLPVLLLLALGLSGCATDGGGDDKTNDRPFNAMITKETPFYLNGPNQQTPPNGRFHPGTRVRILSRHGNHVKVQAVGGLTGFVSATAVGPVAEKRSSWTSG